MLSRHYLRLANSVLAVHPIQDQFHSVLALKPQEHDALATLADQMSASVHELTRSIQHISIASMAPKRIFAKPEWTLSYSYRLLPCAIEDAVMLTLAHPEIVILDIAAESADDLYAWANRDARAQLRKHLAR